MRTADILCRNHEGVLLRYVDPGLQRWFHVSQIAQPSDRERMDIIAAEHELAVLRIIVEHLDVSPIGMTRILHALDVIQKAIDSRRTQLNMGRMVVILRGH